MAFAVLRGTDLLASHWKLTTYNYAIPRRAAGERGNLADFTARSLRNKELVELQMQNSDCRSGALTQSVKAKA